MRKSSRRLRPTLPAMSGIHKAIEQITNYLGSGNATAGRKVLAGFAGCSADYIDDLMTSVQTERHSEEWLARQSKKPNIDQAECLTRAKKLIQAYADSIPK